MSKHFLLLGAAVALAAGSGATMAADLSTAHIGQAIGVTCAGCHGTDGVSAGAAPSLKGLPAAHTAQAMRDFKSGARPSSIMGRIAKGYTNAQFDATAEYFANMK